VTWPEGRAPTGPGLPPLRTGPYQPPDTFPIPEGRGRWRLVLHERVWSQSARLLDNTITEILEARSRRLEKEWNKPARLTFSMDGRHPTAALIRELMTDVSAWRWDDYRGGDVCVFRGVVSHSQDVISEQRHTVNFTCYDYAKMLERRYLLIPQPVRFNNVDQDNFVTSFLGYQPVSSVGGVQEDFIPGDYFPLLARNVAPDGGPRNFSGRLRDRTYAGGTSVGEAIFNLAGVIDGFDWDVWPGVNGNTNPDLFRVFYPYQGVPRHDLALVYGSTVSSVSRTVNSGDYANYWRALGNNGLEDPQAPQVFGEARHLDANNVSAVPVGLWMGWDNQPDITEASTLTQVAQGNLSRSALLTPSYHLGLTPGWYRQGYPNIGDTVPLVIQSGRLNVDTEVRVIGLTYVPNDDAAGGEDVELTVGRPASTFLDLLTLADRQVDALSRR
jgi:hypothetical protein